MVLEQAIVDYFTTTGSVSFTGLGTLRLNQRVEWENAEKVFYYSVDFEHDPNIISSELIEWCKSNCVEYSESLKVDLSKKIDAVNKHINQGERALWQGVGLFIRTSGVIVFSPSVRLPFGKLSYQLTVKENPIITVSRGIGNGLKTATLETVYTADWLYNGRFGKPVRALLLISAISLLGSFAYYKAIPKYYKDRFAKKETQAPKQATAAIKKDTVPKPVPPPVDILELGVAKIISPMDTFAITEGVYTNTITIRKSINALQSIGFQKMTIVDDYKGRMILCFGFYRNYADAQKESVRIKDLLIQKGSTTSNPPLVQRVVLKKDDGKVAKR